MKSAVLFLVFNRPDTTKQVFEAIRAAKPPRLYIAADGARPNKIGEFESCAEVRRIATEVDWPCEVNTLFRDKNLGCKVGVSSGIDWFFENEDEGIILEDDVIPHPEFFKFCELMLERYRNTESVMMISGFNPFGANINRNDYFFSENPSIWGWATWKSRWKLYDVTLKKWPSVEIQNFLKSKFSKPILNFYQNAFNGVKSGEIDTWDYQWTYAIFEKQGLTVKPYANLVTNIGTVGAHATKRDHNHYIEYGVMNIDECIHPSNLSVNKKEDDLFYNTMMEHQNFRYKIIDMLRFLGLYGISKKIYQKLF